MPSFKQLALLALLGPFGGQSEELRGSLHRQLQVGSNEPERTVVLDRMNEVFSSIKETVDSMDENDEDASSRLQLIAEKMQPIIDNFEVMTEKMKEEHASAAEWEMLVAAVDKYSQLQSDIDEKLLSLVANEEKENAVEANDGTEVEDTVEETNESAQVEENVIETSESPEVQEETVDEDEAERVGNRLEMLDNLLLTFDKIDTYMSTLKVSEHDKEKLEQLAETVEKYGVAFVALKEQMTKESAPDVEFTKLAETIGKYSVLVGSVEEKMTALKSVEVNDEVKELRDILGDVQDEITTGDAKGRYPGTENVLNYVESRLQRIDENSQERKEIAELTERLRQTMNDRIAAATTPQVVATHDRSDVMVLSQMLSDVHEEILKGDAIGGIESELSYVESRLGRLEKTPEVTQLSAMLAEMKKEATLMVGRAQQPQLKVQPRQPEVEAKESTTTDDAKIAEIMANLGFPKDKIDQVQSALSEETTGSLVLKEEEEAYEVDEEEKEELEKDEEEYRK